MEISPVKQFDGLRMRRGFTLIELMVALLISLFLSGVVIGVISAAGRSSRDQHGIARLQDNARHALREIARDIRRASSSFCLNYAAQDGPVLPGGVAHVDSRRPLNALFDATMAPFSLGPPTLAPVRAYFVDPAELLLGSECSLTDDGCAPSPSVHPPLARPGSDLPPVRYPVRAGERVRGGDVLSLRYIEGPGTPVTAIRHVDANAGVPAEIDVARPEELAGSSHLLVTDCSVAIVAAVEPLAGGFKLSAANFDGGDTMPPLSPTNARAWDLRRGLQSVTYFLRVDERDAPQALVSNLVRRRAGIDEVVAEGIERLDFVYHVEMADGRTRVLAADQLHALANCRGLATTPGVVVAPAACGWRSLKGIEVTLLANSVDADATHGVQPFRYSWRIDGTPNVAGEFEATETLPSGLPAAGVLRREFRTYVAMRGMNR
jgi:type IV pilus assembly protein PilW